MISPKYATGFDVSVLSKNRIKRFNQMECRDVMACAMAVPKYYDVMIKQYRSGSLALHEDEDTSLPE